MTKIRPLIRYIIVALLLVGIVYFHTILEVFFSSPVREIAPEITRPKSETSRLGDVQSQGPSSDLSSTSEQSIVRARSQKTQLPPKPLPDAQGHREKRAYKESLQSTHRLRATTDLTELELLQPQLQSLLEEQAEQEAAAYEESLQSTDRLRAPTDLTELELLQPQLQSLLEEQAEQEAAAYEESLRSSSFVRSKR